MTTAAQARAVIRSRIEGGGIVDSGSNAVALRWQNEASDSLGQIELPDTPTPFVYTEFLTEPAQLVSFGGGRTNNRYRNRARIESFVFVPKAARRRSARLQAAGFVSLRARLPRLAPCAAP